MSELPIMMPWIWFSAPNEPSVHWSESGVATVTGFAPAAPPAHASVSERRHTALSAFAVTAGCTTYQLRPPSCVPTMTPPWPTAQPFDVSLNDTLCSAFAVGKLLVHEAPASAVRA